MLHSCSNLSWDVTTYGIWLNFIDINITGYRGYRGYTIRELLFPNPFESQLRLPSDLDPTVDTRLVRLVGSGKVQASRELMEYHCEIIRCVVT